MTCKNCPLLVLVYLSIMAYDRFGNIRSFAIVVFLTGVNPER
jgi:hypothetical protein